MFGKHRDELYTQDVWDYVWCMMDCDPEVSSVDAGLLASACEVAFQETLKSIRAGNATVDINVKIPVTA